MIIRLSISTITATSSYLEKTQLHPRAGPGAGQEEFRYKNHIFHFKDSVLLHAYTAEFVCFLHLSFIAFPRDLKLSLKSDLINYIELTLMLGICLHIVFNALVSIKWWIYFLLTIPYQKLDCLSWNSIHWLDPHNMMMCFPDAYCLSSFYLFLWVAQFCFMIGTVSQVKATCIPNTFLKQQSCCTILSDLSRKLPFLLYLQYLLYFNSYVCF